VVLGVDPLLILLLSHEGSLNELPRFDQDPRRAEWSLRDADSHDKKAVFRRPKSNEGAA